MKTPLLSIIIPFYNVEEWLLKRCIESILEQSLNDSDYEIIIIDDGSNRSPQSTINSFNKENIKYFSQTNQGPGGARNTGMKVATGQYIQFIDSDDFIHANTLSQCITILKEKSPDLFNFSFISCQHKERKPVQQPSVRYAEWSSGAEYMYTHNIFGSSWVIIFKKEIVLRNDLWFTPGIYHEDEEFPPLLYFYANKIISSNIIMYAYYKRGDSIIKKQDPEHLKRRSNDFKGVIKRLQEFQEVHKDKSSELQQKALNRKINLLACDYIICMVRNKSSHKYIQGELKVLKKLGLYPLPNESYSLKYKLFRALTYNPIGIYLLYIIEPFRTKI